MKLEQEIQQKKFRSEHHKLVVNIIYTSNWLNYIYSKVFKQAGITIQQYNILRILRGQHPQPSTIGLLTERMLDKMSNASRLVDKLCNKGLTERKTCRSDRRAVDVFITKKGMELLDRLDKKEKEMNAVVESLNKEEAAVLNTLLDKLRG